MEPVEDRVVCGQPEFDDSQRVLAVALQAYIAMDAAGRVVAWNPAAAQTFGFSFDQACGQDLAELIIPPRSRAAHRAGLARLAAGGTGRVLGQRLQVSAVHRDGHEFPVELSVTMTREHAGTMFHAFAHDVTTAQRVSRFTVVESAVARGLAEAASSRQAAARVVEALAVRMGWQVAELWWLDEPRQLLSCAARHQQAELRLGSFALSQLEYGTGLPGLVCERAAPHWIADLAADTRLLRNRAAAQSGLHVAVGVPVCTGGRVLGALCVYGHRAEDPEETVTALLSGIAAQVGQYVERRRAEELTVELARTKDEFLAMVTHEMRNPLAVISAAAMLLEEDLPETLTGCREHAATIIRSTHRLTVITDDLLDLARLESGNLAVEPCDTDLCTVIGDAVQAVAGPARDKKLTVTVRLPAHLAVYADPHRLRQVADNLISNAVKYTPAGGTVTVTADAVEGGRAIVWQVTDTGIGIPAAERPKLFRRFYRASTAIERRIPGTGLGLVITRAIVERHGGTIDLVPTTGPGSTFQIRLPCKPTATEQ